MTNRFYNTSFTALPLTLIRSAAVNGQYALVGAGFETLAIELDGYWAEITAGRQGQASLAANFSRYITGSGGLTQNLAANSFRITGLPAPSAGSDAVTKTYADAIQTYADGLSFATVLPAQTGSAGKFITTDGVTASWGYASPEVTLVSGTTQAAVTNRHYILTNVAATTLTLPATPAVGDTVWVTPGNSLTTNIVARNGSNIMSLAEDMTVDNANATVQFRYINSTLGWRFV